MKRKNNQPYTGFSRSPHVWEVPDKRVFPTPADLWAAFAEYAEHTAANPWNIPEPIKAGKTAGQFVDVPKTRPLTWEGFGTYLALKGVFVSLHNYRENTDGRYTEFSNTVRAITDAMHAQKFDGAAVGAFDARLVVIKLGLAAKAEREKAATEQPLFGDFDDETGENDADTLDDLLR